MPVFSTSFLVRPLAQAVPLVGGILAAASVSLAQSELYHVDSGQQITRIGRSLDGVGDLNGDGAQEWIVAGAQGAEVRSGADGSVIFTLSSSFVFGGFTGVAGLGDLSGDGLPEFMISAASSAGDFDRSGEVFVFSGATGSVLRSHSGSAEDARFGGSIAALTDMNGDGVSDYAVGAPGARIVKVYSGLSGSVMASYSSDETYFGSFVGDAGDFDQDGRSDLILCGGIDFTVRVVRGEFGSSSHPVLLEIDGMPYWNPSTGNGGFGERALSLGDVNGDGIPELIIPSRNEQIGTTFLRGRVRMFDGATGALIWTQSGETFGFGQDLDLVGDLDGDGTVDLAVGAPGYQGSFAAGIVGGGETEPQGSVSVLSGAHGRRIYLYHGAYRYDGFGSSVASLGDVNGDGLSEIAVGAPASFDPVGEPGRVTVYSGAGCPQPRRYCVALPHSESGFAGIPAKIGFKGSLSFAESDLELWVVDATRNQAGAFFLAMARARVPVGDGILCLGGPRALLGAAPTNFAGFGLLRIDGLPQAPWSIGETVLVQHVFRDPGNTGGVGLNFSDALALTICP